MQQIENNAFFWQKLDTIYASSKIVIEAKKGTPHSKIDSLVYPVEYGYLADTHGAEGGETLALFKGDNANYMVDAIAISINTLNRTSEIKLIIGCTDDEIFKIMQFLNETEFQKAILVRRSDDMSDWDVLD